MSKRRDNSIWYDRKRTLFGLPLSFTKYELTDDRLFIEEGFFNTIYNEVRLYRITDVQLTRSLLQKMFGVGTIIVHSSDASLKNFEIKSIKKSNNIIEILSKQVEIQRKEHRVYAREIVDNDIDDEDLDDDDNNII